MKFIFLTLSVLFSSHCAFSKRQVPEIKHKDIKVEELLSRDDSVWGFDFLPEGKIIFTLRSGKMFIHDVKSKTTSEVTGLPKIYAVGQGGLLDIRVHPDFKKNNLIYFSYSESVGTLATTAVMKAELKETSLSNGVRIFLGVKPNDNDTHFGSRIEFDGKGHIYISMGDRDNREKAQDLSYHQGKILRLHEEGKIPQDNPFIKNKNARPEIWSYGHRNPQGLALNPLTGDLWEAEMGPRGGDEINLIGAGKNYGWPVITYGREYYGPKIGEKIKDGMEQPVSFWVPSISPSGITFYTGDKLASWKNNLFMATLSGNHVRRIVLKDNIVVEQEILLKELDYRYRCLRTGPDGFLYLSTDEGKILRLLPK